MKRLLVATGLALLGLSLQGNGNPAIAQANMKNGHLNIQLRQALCAQDWTMAIRTIDQIKKVTTQNRQELNYYRARLVIMRNQRTRIPAWPSTDYCAGKISDFWATDNGDTTEASPPPPPAPPNVSRTNAAPSNNGSTVVSGTIPLEPIQTFNPIRSSREAQAATGSRVDTYNAAQ